MDKRAKAKKSTSGVTNIFSKAYDSSHRWKYDLRILKFLAFLFVIVNFHWLNKHPILKLHSITITEGLFLVYASLFFILLKDKFSFKIQGLNIVLDFLFIAFFDYLSLSFFGYNSKIYALYFIPVIYCGYWFSRSFTLIFVTLVSLVYGLLYYHTPDMGFLYTPWEKIVRLALVISFFYLCGLAVIRYKKRVQIGLKDVDRELKERAETLEQLKESTQTLLKDKIDGFIAIDEKGNITEANELARELLGYAKREIYKKNVEVIYASGEASIIMNKLRESPDGTINNVKTWMRSKDKEEEKIPILLSASFLYNRDLNFKKVLSTGKKLPSIGYFREVRAEDMFSDIGEGIASITDEKELLDEIAETVTKTLKSEACNIFIYNEQNRLIESIGSFGIPEPLKGRRGIESYAEKEGETGTVFASGETQNIPNIDVAKKKPKKCNMRWPTARKFAKHSRFKDFKHFLATPLSIQGEVYGVIRVINKYRTAKELDKQGFTKRDIFLLKRISIQVAILLEKVRNRERFETISKVGIELNAKVDVNLDELLGTIAERVVEGMKFKSCSLRMIEGNKLRLKARDGLTGEYEDDYFTLEIGEGISGEVAKTGEMKNLEDLENEENFKFKKELLQDEGLKSMLSIPLKYHERVIGVINCYTGRKHKFTEQEIRIMETFAVYAAVAIQNKKRMDEWLALNEIGRELLKLFKPGESMPFGSEELLDIILRQAKAISRADSLCIKIYDKTSRDVSTVRALNCEWYDQNRDFKFILRDDNLSKGFKFGEPIIIEDFDMKKDMVKDVPYKELMKNIKSRAILPFEIYGKISGELCLESFRENFFTEDKSLILNTFANQVTITLKNAYFLNRLQMVTETFPKISEFDVDIDRVLENISGIAAHVLETDILVLFLYDAKHKKIKWPPIHFGDIRYPELMKSEDISSGIPLSFIERGTSHYSKNSKKERVMGGGNKPLPGKLPGRFVYREGIESSAGIVLKVGQEIVGVMFLNYRTPHEFNVDEWQIVEIFASYIAIAIRNVIYVSEKRTADTMNALGKLSTNYAHKIKNDISTIRLYTSDLMSEIQKDAPQYFPLTQIKEKVLKITEDLDFLAKISKAHTPQKQRIDIHDFIKKIKPEILTDLAVKKIELELEIQPGLPKIEIDPTQVKMVFINLAQNSADAMQNGGKVILSISESGKAISFEWTDTGCGVPPEDGHKIFDILWSRKDKGSGLGLFYAKTIIEGHGGTISLDTAYKEGARFVFVIPVKEPLDSPEA